MSDLPKFAGTKLLHQWKYDSPLIACRFDPTGKYVFTAAENHAIQRWDLASGSPTVLAGHDSWVRSLGFSPDGQTLYSAGYDGRLLTWNVAPAAPEIVRRVDAHQGWVRCLDVTRDGRAIATGGNDNRVRVWNAADGTLLHEFGGHEAHVYSVLFHPSENLLLSGDLMGKVHQWDLSAGALVRTFDAAELYTPNEGQGAKYGGVRSMALSPDGKLLACGGLYKASNPFGAVQEPLVLVFAWDSAEKLQSLVADKITQGIVWRTVFHASGTLLAGSGGGSGGFVLVWDPTVTQTVHQFQLPNTVLDLDLNPAGTQVVTAHHDQHVRISELA
jgi:WD40 repeat protein